MPRSPAEGLSMERAIPGATLARLHDDVLERLFTPAHPDAPPRVGLELEVIPVDALTRRPLPVRTGDPFCGAALLRDAARACGWRELDAAHGAPRWRTRSGGTLSFEPGGQIEYGTAPVASLPALLDDVRAVMRALGDSAALRGAELVEAGIDPDTPLAGVPLQLDGERYRRMDAYFGALGDAGRRMMRQTAALQVNLDLGADPAQRWLRWRVLGRAAPYLTAAYATSRWYAGRRSGHASHRAWTWRELDPTRTGVVPAGRDLGEAAALYTRFALDARWMLDPDVPAEPDAEDYRSFGDALAAGRTGEEEWRAHLTTLFPEVRPRGWLEVRCLDALPVAHVAEPVTVLAGLAYDPAALRDADALLSEPDAALLRRAARRGASDPGIARVARRLVAIGREGARRLPHDAGACDRSA